MLLSIFFNALLFGHGLGGETSVTTSEKHREPIFYLPKTGQWIPAVALQEGDQLFSRPCGPISITQRELAYGMHTVYSITVEKTNAFFAGRFGILVHNMILPLALSGTISLPFGAVGGIFGGFFGIPTFALSAGLAGLLGLVQRHSFRTRNTYRGRARRWRTIRSSR